MEDASQIQPHDEREKKLELVGSLMLSKLAAQQFAHDSLESKIGVLLGFVATVLAILFGFVFNNILLFDFNLFTLGLAGLFLTLIFLALASKTREYLDPPDFSGFYSEEALSRNYLDLKNSISADMKECYTLNLRNQQAKGALYNYGLLSLVLSLISVILGIIQVQR